MTQTCPRVIKLGGSLLDWCELAPSFRRWLSAQSEAVNIMIVGGGAIVDAVRQLDARHRLTAEAAHWLSIRAMGLTAHLAGGLLGEATCVRSLDELRLWAAAGLQILDVERFLREDQASADALPCGWEVTSDSIAARVASVLAARELVLLKSTLPEGASNREELVNRDTVDLHFACVSRRLAVRIVNLRDPKFSQIAFQAEHEPIRSAG